MQRLPTETCNPRFVVVNSWSFVTEAAANLLTTDRIPHTDLHNARQADRQQAYRHTDRTRHTDLHNARQTDRQTDSRHTGTFLGIHRKQLNAISN